MAGPAVSSVKERPMPDPKARPQPDGAEDDPQPNHPKDPSVYGGKWGGDGEKHPGRQPPDRPDRIKAPSESS
jgi:hypothetical protein